MRTVFIYLINGVQTKRHLCRLFLLYDVTNGGQQMYSYALCQSFQVVMTFFPPRHVDRCPSNFNIRFASTLLYFCPAIQ